MTITYQTRTEFYDGVYELVRRGLTFTASGTHLTVTLLGGY